MEVSASIAICNNKARMNNAFAGLAYIVLCLRGYFAGIIEDTLAITLLINLLIACSIDYSKVKQSFFIFAVLSLLVVYNRDALALVDILALLYVLRNIDFKYIIKVNMVSISLYFMLWIVFLQLGILQDKLEIMPKGVAHCLGYANPNQLGMLGFQIIASLFLVCSGKKRILVFFSIPLINEIFFSWSISRTPWIGGYVIMLIMVLSAIRVLRPSTKYMVAFLPIIIYLGLIYFAKHIDDYPELDILFTTRFSNYSKLLHSLTPLNWLIGFQQTEDIIIDSSYLMIFCSGGILALFVFWRRYIKTTLTRWKWIHPYLPFIIAILAVGIGENAFSSVSGLSLIFWYIIFYPNKVQPYDYPTKKNDY